MKIFTNQPDSFDLGLINLTDQLLNLNLLTLENKAQKCSVTLCKITEKIQVINCQYIFCNFTGFFFTVYC